MDAPEMDLPDRIVNVLQDAARPLPAMEIGRQLGGEIQKRSDCTWARVADTLSEMTRAGTLRRVPQGSGGYAWELSHAKRKELKNREARKEPRMSPAVRAALVSSAVTADAALDRYVEQLGDSTLSALIGSTRNLWRTCAVVGVPTP